MLLPWRLQGGYCEKSQAESAALSLMALLDDPCPSLGPIVSTSERSVWTVFLYFYFMTILEWIGTFCGY